MSKIHQSHGVQCQDNIVEQQLEQLDSYILYAAHRCVRRISSVGASFSPDMAAIDADELAQRVRIKMWLALKEQEIQNPRAYVWRVAHTENLHLLRQKWPKHIQYTLPMDDEGEIRQGYNSLSGNSLAADPAFQVEQNDAEQYYMTLAVQAIAVLPEKQQQAMLYSLKERVDDITIFVNVCKTQGLNLDALKSPETPNELQKLRALISVARKKLRALFKSSHVSMARASQSVEGLQRAF